MRRALFAFALSAVLAGCGTLAPRAPSSGPMAGLPAAGGGYYENDGPGAKPPADLASIPNAQPRVEPLIAAANRPYEVFGKRYAPLTRVEPFHERGIASWYGRKFQGLKTSSGEPYNMYAMTAAHPTLPIPSYARVTDLANGRSVVVQINDRGPFWPGRIIDLSYAAAYKLGFAAAGSAEVEVDAIVPGKTQLAQAPVAQSTPAAQPAAPAASALPASRARTAPPAQPAPSAPPAQPAPPVLARVAASDVVAQDGEPKGVYLQLGAFSVRADAESFRAHVQRELSWITRALYVVSTSGLFKVHLGPFNSEDGARTAAARIRDELNFSPMLVVR